MREDAASDTFEGFFEREYETLLRAMWLLVSSRWEAEELAQEAMVRAFERWPLVQAARNPAGYVYKIALNLHRRRSRRVWIHILHAGTHARNDMDSIEQRSDILRALDQLPLAQREAVVLVDWLGFTPQDLGQALGVRAVTIRGRLHRGRATLRTELGEDR